MPRSLRRKERRFREDLRSQGLAEMKQPRVRCSVCGRTLDADERETTAPLCRRHVLRQAALKEAVHG